MVTHFKLAILAFLMLIASVAVDATLQSNSMTKITKEELLLAEIKAIIGLKQVEKAVDSFYANEKSIELLRRLRMLGEQDCLPSGRVCAGGGPPEQCCSGSCVPHPRLKVFVCA